MSIPIEYQGKKYFITDRNTLEKYSYFFVGYMWVDNTRYKKYLAANKMILVEA